MESIKLKLKNQYPNFSDRIDRMALIATEIIYSKDSFEILNDIVPKLYAIDAFVLGMIMAERMISIAKNNYMIIEPSYPNGTQVSK